MNEGQMIQSRLLYFLLLGIVVPAAFIAPKATATKAQTSAAWRQITTDSAPSAQYHHVFVAASDMGKLVFFGRRNPDTLVLATNLIRGDFRQYDGNRDASP
jgi:hypothetical protein